jgi:hypothetical protein
MRDSFGRRLRDDRGVALPVALTLLFLVAALTSVAAKAGVVASHQSLRDRNSKRAMQAAAAGVDAATYELNMMQPGNLECIIKDAVGTLHLTSAQPDGWCVTRQENLDDGASFTTRVSAGVSLHTNGQLLVQRKIVSTGTVNGVQRRMLVTKHAAIAEPLFPSSYAAISVNSVNFGNSTIVNGGVGSNGDITLTNTAEVCGPATPGPDSTLYLKNSATVCAGYSTAPASTRFVLAPVDQRNTTTVNDNGRICGADPCTGSVSWNASTRTLTLTNSGTITLSGGVYNFCKLELRNTSQLRIAARSTPLRIYFDTPEACGAGTNWTSLSVAQTSAIVNLNENPTSMEWFVSGSPTKPTSVDFGQSGDPTQDLAMTMYAPQSTVNVTQSVHIKGAIVAKQLAFSQSIVLTYDGRVTGITARDTAALFQDEGWVECTANATSVAPDSGC